MTSRLPKSTRERLAAAIAIEMLVQGVFFDSRSLRGPSFNERQVTRVLDALIDSRVITRSMPRMKYVLTDEFLDTVKSEVTRLMPRRLFIHYPDFEVFDISGIESWSQEEFELYMKELKKHWLARRVDGRKSVSAV